MLFVLSINTGFSDEELLWLVCFRFAQHLCFSSSDSPLPVTSRVCFVKFHESESVGVSQHLTNTVFVDRALIVVPFAEGECLEQYNTSFFLGPLHRSAKAKVIFYPCQAETWSAWHSRYVKGRYSFVLMSWNLAVNFSLYLCCGFHSIQVICWRAPSLLAETGRLLSWHQARKPLLFWSKSLLLFCLCLMHLFF